MDNVRHSRKCGFSNDGVCFHSSAISNNDGEDKEVNAKEYLNQARVINARIQARKDEITRLEAMLLRGISYEGDVGSSTPNSNGNEQIIFKIVELKGLLNHQLLELVEKQTEILATIDRLTEANEIVVLSKRYLQMKAWTTICNEMGYSDARVYQIHKSALDHIDELLNIIVN